MKRDLVPVGLLLAGLAVAAGAAMILRSSRAPGPSGGEFDYELDGLFHVEPALLTHEEVARFDVGLRAPIGIDTTDGGTVCVVGDSVLREFRDGALVREIQLGGSPTCLDASTGTFHLGFGNRVEAWDAAKGARVARWEPFAEDSQIVSIAAARSGVYAADARRRVVWRCDAAGKVVGRLGEKDEDGGIPGLVVPSPHLDVAVGRDGLIRVANPGRHSIEAYTPDGHLELAWGETSNGLDGFSGCCNPCAFAILGDGSFVTCEKGIPRVKHLGAKGELLGVVAGPLSFEEGRRAFRADGRSGDDAVLDVAVDASGRTYVLDPLERKVLVFARKAASAGAPGSDGGNDG